MYHVFFIVIFKLLIFDKIFTNYASVLYYLLLILLICLAGLCSIVTATISYNLFEKKFLNMKERFSVFVKE